MLTIILEETTETPRTTLRLEHSLVSLSRWEAIHERPFMPKKGDPAMTPEETVSYILQMALEPVPSWNWIEALTVEDYKLIAAYIDSKQTATWFREEADKKGPREVITAELIYYWMIAFNIPFDPCQNWHISRLMTLIKICSLKQEKPKKMSRREQAEQYRRINEERRRQLGTSG